MFVFTLGFGESVMPSVRAVNDRPYDLILEVFLRTVKAKTWIRKFLTKSALLS